MSTNTIYNGIKYYAPLVVPLQGYLILALLLLIVGPLLGLALFATAHILYIPLLFPLLIGFIGAWLFSAGIKLTKIRNPVLAVLCAGLMGFVIYGTYYYAHYQAFTDAAIAEIKQQAVALNRSLSDEDAARIVDELFRRKTNATGLFGYMIFETQNGIKLSFSILKSGVVIIPDGNLTFVGVFAVLYRLVEIGINVIVMMTHVRRNAHLPFDERTNTWFNVGYECIGSVPNKDIEAFYNEVCAGNYVSAGRLVIPEDDSVKGDLDVCLRFTPRGKSGSILLFGRQTLGRANGKSTRGTVFQQLIDYQNYQDLVSTFEQADEEESSQVA